MKTCNRVITLIATAMLTLSLGACGSSSGPKDVANTNVEVQKPFEGREARDSSELNEFIDKANRLADERTSAVADNAEEAKLNESVNKRFTKANEAYAEGDYETAQARYEKVLETYPMHYGANVNLTLALLEQEKAEEALVQALTCCRLFSTQYEPLLNVQVAGVACGFDVDDLETAMDSVIALEASDLDSLKGRMTQTYEDYYEYNRLWSQMETDLYDAVHEVDAQSEESEDAANTTDEAAEEGDADASASPREAYNVMEAQLVLLKNTYSSDTDMSGLYAYLYAVGLQLGYQVDPSRIDPVHTMPFIAVDNEQCTIEFKNISDEEDYWNVSITLTNKLSEEALEVECLDSISLSTWTANGIETTASINGVSAAPGQTVNITLVLDRPAGADSSLVSFMGGLSVKADGVEIARYPVSWVVETD